MRAPSLFFLLVAAALLASCGDSQTAKSKIDETPSVVAGGAEVERTFGVRGGLAPANLDAFVERLRQDPYDIELLISFGTSKGGSAGHLALAIRDQAPGDDLVYSANFYADREEEHAKGFYTQELMARIPKKEYLFGTRSSLGETASFGLDFGETYKRSVVGIRVYGVPAAEKEALAAFFQRINDDYHNRTQGTEYHPDEIKYGYLTLNCAKTIGMAFKYGAGYDKLEVKNPRHFTNFAPAAALGANMPTEMALKLMDEWNRRGYTMDVALYRKYWGSPYVDPHDEERVPFKDLPNRFPSVLSRDFRREEGQYKDYDNLFAMYLLYNLGRYSIRVNQETDLVIEAEKSPMTYREAKRLAVANASEDSGGFRRDLPFLPRGRSIGEKLEAKSAP